MYSGFIYPCCRCSLRSIAYHTPWSQKTISTSRVSLASILCTQGLFTPVVGAAWGVAVVWRILLVGTDGSLYLIVRCLFQFRCLNSALWTWYCNNVFPRTLIVWNRLSIVSSFSLLDPRWKTWSVQVLPWGVLDGIVRCSLLSGCLVSGGRRAPPEACYFGRFYHTTLIPCSIMRESRRW